jgi:large subunit ribosomal protein L15
MVPGFEGGQMPLQRRLPKRGFKNIFKVYFQVVNVADLEAFETGTVVTAALLKTQGKIKSLRRPVKILGNGELTKSLTIRADQFSQSAKQKIVAAGGSAEETSA